MRRSALILACTAAQACAPVATRPHAPPAATRSCGVHLDDVERTIHTTMRDRQIPGLVVGFDKAGCRWVRAYGVADLEHAVAMTIDASFRLASLQKTMTAVAVLQLADAGALDLDAPIQRYVPYYPDKSWPITARQLLSHLGGVPHYVDRDREQHITMHKTTRESIEIFAQFPLIAEPGTTYSYSSYGYNLLGAAIEAASGQSFGDYMRDHVWAVAGMTDTRLDHPRAVIPRRVHGYQLIDDAVANSEFIDVSSRFAAGGTRGTVPDLLRFLAALDGGKLLAPATVRAMYEPARTRGGEPVPYALGWQIPPVRDRGSLVTNDGGQQETRTFILHDPGARLSIALAMNLEADVYGPIVLALYRAIAGHPLELVARP